MKRILNLYEGFRKLSPKPFQRFKIRFKIDIVKYFFFSASIVVENDFIQCFTQARRQGTEEARPSLVVEYTTIITESLYRFFTMVLRSTSPYPNTIQLSVSDESHHRFVFDKNVILDHIFLSFVFFFPLFSCSS